MAGGNSFRFFWRVLAYFRQDWGKVLATVLMLLASKGAELLTPFIAAILVDVVFVRAQSLSSVERFFIRVAPSGIIGQVMLLAALSVALRAGQVALRMAQGLVNTYTGYNGLMRVRCDLFRKLQELSIAYHKSQPQGDVIYRLSYDTWGYQNILNVFMNTVLVSIGSLAAMAAIMLAMNWKLALITLAVGPILVVTTKYFAPLIQKKSLESKEQDSLLTSSIQQAISTMPLVQAFGRERAEFERFEARAQSSFKATIRQTWQETIYWCVVGLIFALGYGIILGYGGVIVYRGGLNVGHLLVFLAYVDGVYAPLQTLGSTGASIAGAVASVQRVQEVLDRDPIIHDGPHAMHLPTRPRTLSLENVAFAYKTEEPVLRGISAEIAPGEMVAFVGSSGVGKTTLLNLLPRFYDPTGGAIRLDGNDARQIKIADLRKHIALVLQESVMLPTTIRENIAYGRPDAPDAAVRRAAELAGAAAFIEKFEMKYEAPVAEGGSNLSGGQRQRIAIARALLTEAPIVVLDEPTSALDPTHEQLITQTLSQLKRQRTMILVSHRLSTVIDCDRIFVMDDGRIVERGTHAELLAMRGVYFAMARHQLQIADEPVTAGHPAA
jgi:ABC-type multidrug transport system fused ATPase/permease subunit